MGMSIVIDWPIASSARVPNNRSAPWFHDVMMPVKSLLTIASSDDSTIAARRRAASGGRTFICSTRLYPFKRVVPVRGTSLYSFEKKR